MTKGSHPVIIIKPKDSSQKSTVTKAKLREEIDPSNFPIRNIRESSNGGVLIECVDGTDTGKFLKDAVTKLGNGYKIKTSTGRCPKVKIIGFMQDLTNEKIMDSLTKQNTEIFADCSKPKIVHRFKTKKSFGIKLEVDGSLFKRMIDAGSVNIGWDTCFVYEALDVLRCFKCCGYHHLAKSCKNSKLCAKCGQAHENECESSTERCVNCCNAAKRLKIDIDVAHSAFSKDCTVYRRKLDIERKKINYNFQHVE